MGKKKAADVVELQQVRRKCTPASRRYVAGKIQLLFFQLGFAASRGKKFAHQKKGSEAPGLERRDELSVVDGKNNSPPDSRDFLLPAVTEGAAASSRTSTAA